MGTDDETRIRLVVIFGGRSAEHDVSCVTARHVLAAVDPTRYEVVPVGITREGEWVLAEEAAVRLAQGPDALPDALDPSGPGLEPLTLVAGSPGPTTTTTVVLPLLHGPLGEDGTVQGLLELAGVPYVGSGVLGSALAMDKAKAKEVLAHHGVPQAHWRTLTAPQVGGTGSAALLDDLAAELGLPLFVKPANMGSSVGVSKAHDLDELAVALDLATSYDHWVVVEEAIVGRELEVSVLGNDDLRLSVPGEVIPGKEFYDYDDKYVDGAARLVIPAALEPGVVDDLHELASLAYRALRAEGMARVDFLYEQSDRGLLVNEVNTIPGFTPISMYPRLWEASGLAYPDLIDELVRLALERHARHRHRTDR